VSGELMTRREVGAMFGVTSAAVAQWARRGLLPEVRDEDGKPAYRRADAEELRRSGQQAGMPGVVQVRLIGETADIRRVRDLLAGAGAEVLTASGARVARRDPGARVHLTVRLPGGEGR
jgi:MerR HTH family regulatory protein